MKIKNIFLCSLLAFALLLGCFTTGCAKQASDPPEDPEILEEDDYLTRITALEAELQRQREEQYISNAARDAQIKELKQQLQALGADVETDISQTPDGEELIFSYRLENGKAIITDYSGTSTLVTVPTALDGYPVVAIGERAFEGKHVAAVILPEGLEAVGWFAFYGCAALIDVTIPTSVTSIGYAVFDGCPNVSVICAKDSYAAQYAKSYGLPYISNS